MRTLRAYADTSVFGGCFDEKFASPSRAFLGLVAAGRFRLVVSALTAQELLRAPDPVRSLFTEIHTASLEFHEITPEMLSLKDQYILAGILGSASEADALHVAAASVLGVDVILSWNFRHIVHFEKIRGFNAINRLQGYKTVEIYSPLEVA